MAMEDKKTRKPKWGDREMTILCQSVADNFRIIKGKFSPSVTHEKKMAVWRDICEKSVDEIKKRWQDAQTNYVKKKENERKKLMNGTGGGSEPDIYFRKWELIVLGTLSPTAIVGIEGAVDTSCPQPQLSLAPPNTDANDSHEEITIEEKAVNVSGDVEEIPEQFQEMSKTKRKNAVENLDLPAELLVLKKKKLENDEIFREKLLQLEEMKVTTIMKIQESLSSIEETIKEKQTYSPSLNLSPIIKFT